MVQDVDAAIKYVNDRPNPLSLYVCARDSAVFEKGAYTPCVLASHVVLTAIQSSERRLAGLSLSMTLLSLSPVGIDTTLIAVQCTDPA